MADTIPQTIPLNGYKALIDAFFVNSNNIKHVNINFSDAPKRNVNDMFTNIISEYMSTTTNIINNFFFLVNKFFGDYDVINLNPYSAQIQNRSNITNDTKLMIPNVADTINMDNYNINANKIMNNGTYQGFFVFKGGNAFKYWTQKKYLEMHNFVDNTIENVLSENIQDTLTNNFMLGFSDFDFCYYTNGGFTKNDYRKLIIHSLIRLYRLRYHLEKQIMYNGVSQLFNNNKLHCAIQEYFNNYGKTTHNEIVTFHQQISKPHIVYDCYITYNNHLNNIQIYKVPTNNFMHVSANNTILTTYNDDFDLYRIKMDFHVTNNIKEEIFAGEIFDLTILRPDDIHKNIFCNNITRNTRIITNEFGHTKIDVRIYSMYYVLSDLIRLLFIRNNFKTIFPWIDKKYNKRIQRLGILYAGYLDELRIFNPISNEYMFGLASILFLTFLNYRLNELKNNFFTRDINLARTNYETIINISIMDTTKFIMKNLASRIEFSGLIGKLDEIRNIINEPISPINITNDFEVLLNDNVNYQKNIFITIIRLTIIYIKKIFYENDIKWCTINYGDRINIEDDSRSPDYYNINRFRPIDIHDFSIKISDFMNILIKYIYIGLNMQTNILREFCEQLITDPTELQNGGSGDTMTELQKNTNSVLKNMKKTTTSSNTVEHNNIVVDLITNSIIKLNDAYNNVLYNDVDNAYYEYDNMNRPIKIVPKLLIDDIYNNDKNMIKFIKEQNKIYNKILNKNDKYNESVTKQINNELANFF